MKLSTIDFDDIYTKRKLREMKKLIGAKVLDHLVAGTHQLYIWKKSNPPNWYISPSDNRHDYSWHSCEERREYPRLNAFSAISITDSINIYVLRDDVIQWYKNNPNCETQKYMRSN